VALYSVDEYECVQNETSYETGNYFVFLPLCNLPTFKPSDSGQTIKYFDIAPQQFI